MKTIILILIGSMILVSCSPDELDFERSSLQQSHVTAAALENGCGGGLAGDMWNDSLDFSMGDIGQNHNTVLDWVFSREWPDSTQRQSWEYVSNFIDTSLISAENVFGGTLYPDYSNPRGVIDSFKVIFDIMDDENPPATINEALLELGLWYIDGIFDSLGLSQSPAKVQIEDILEDVFDGDTLFAAETHYESINNGFNSDLESSMAAAVFSLAESSWCYWKEWEGDRWAGGEQSMMPFWAILAGSDIVGGLGNMWWLVIKCVWNPEKYCPEPGSEMEACLEALVDGAVVSSMIPLVAKYIAVMSVGL